MLSECMRLLGVSLCSRFVDYKGYGRHALSIDTQRFALQRRHFQRRPLQAGVRPSFPSEPIVREESLCMAHVLWPFCEAAKKMERSPVKRRNIEVPASAFSPDG